MKRLFNILTMVVLFVGCTPDFDPQTDSDQRNATFRFDTEHLFDDVLSQYVDHAALGDATISDTQRIRIAVFCYDAGGVLLNKAILFANHGETLSVTFRHLMKDTPYHFIFLGDVVEYENETDYVERWFHLNYQQLDQFYTVFIYKSWSGAKDVLWHCDTTLFVENKTYDIPLNQQTYNGYIFFINNAGVEELSISCEYHTSLYLSPLSGREKKFFSNSTTAPITEYGGWGYTIPKIDSTINFEITLKESNGTHVVNKSVVNLSCRPFQIYFNCATKEIEQVNFY